MLINLRNALMSGKPLPYDAEVEYLEGDGTAYIATGVSQSAGDTIHADFTFGYKSGSSSRRFIVSDGYANHSRYCDISSGNRLSVNSRNTLPVLTAEQLYSGYITLEPNKTSLGVIVNETSYTDEVSATSTWTSNNILIFRINSTYAGSGQRIAMMKLYKNGVLVRDFIPVRRGTVGYLYDRVSGKLFGNAGTGDFVLGPDVVPVEYLQSDGNAYIDTGVKPDATYTFDSTVAVMQSNYNCVYWGCRSSGTYQTDNNQCYLTSNTSSTAGEKFRRIRLLSTGVDSNANWDSGIVPQTGVFYQLSEMSTASTMNTMTYPVILFGLNNIGQILTNVGNARIAKWTAYKGGAKANNFLPVRVGTEGAMMDVLTRRVYRNAGTGAFTYGNDLKYPIPAS